jgi:multidrug transporter EmrE-like cation transporter
MSWIYLLTAGVFEVGFTTSLKALGQFFQTVGVDWLSLLRSFF